MNTRERLERLVESARYAERLQCKRDKTSVRLRDEAEEGLRRELDELTASLVPATPNPSLPDDATARVRLVGCAPYPERLNTKIGAIRIVREVTGMGLRESKDFVDMASIGDARTDGATLSKLNATMTAYGYSMRFESVEKYPPNPGRPRP